MAEIKINQLNSEVQSEIIDLKAEAEKGNSEAIIAFKSLRGGLSRSKPCWCTQNQF